MHFALFCYPVADHQQTKQAANLRKDDRPLVLFEQVYFVQCEYVS
jgi:hypothetical protein